MMRSMRSSLAPDFGKLADSREIASTPRMEMGLGKIAQFINRTGRGLVSETTEAILRGVLATMGRAVFSLEDIHAIVNPTGNATKQVKAYNLADGTRTQGDIANKLNIDSGNFSRTVNRWIKAGIVLRLPDNVLLHVYPVPEKLPKGG